MEWSSSRSPDKLTPIGMGLGENAPAIGPSSAGKSGFAPDGLCTPSFATGLELELGPRASRTWGVLCSQVNVF